MRRSLSVAVAAAGFVACSSEEGTSLDAHQGQSLRSARRPRRETLEAARSPEARVTDERELLAMEDYIDQQRDPRTIIDTIRVDDEEVVDCVDPRWQHGLGREVTIIDVPPAGPAPQPDPSASPQRYGTETRLCPQGSVPKRRTRIEDLVRHVSLADYFRKSPSPFGPPGQESTGGRLMRSGPSSFHQYAAFHQFVRSIGAEASLSLHNPRTEVAFENSISQVWVVRGDGADLETVEAGWVVNRAHHGGSWSARLFAYFTPDAYADRGCYDLTCPGFVQVSNAFVLGGAFSVYSSPGQYEATVNIRLQMSAAKHWWLAVNGTWLGFWPNDLFDARGLADEAARIAFGGEVNDSRPHGRHTGTDMGSAHFPSSGYLWSAFQRTMRYYAGSPWNPDLLDVSPNAVNISWPGCYDADLAFDPTARRTMFFGGPGFGASCE